MIPAGLVTDITVGESQLRRWRCARIVMQGGRFVKVQRRWMAGSVSVAQVWWQAKYGRMNDDVCWLDYHQPFGMPGFLTLDYIRSGQRAGYKTFIGAIRVLEEIARIRNSVAIVAHVTNGGISDRLLERNGWQRHLEEWSGRHWIRRFYDGYPESTVERYTQTSIGRPACE
ncbi:hypothetical protein Pla52o_17960 [Novipirellula galeiformis]|uniref:N-acetyltransferase domain-containing protein n=1 Tax=Novipirellula galeiformis TaxID=2528004 RepID=A0A5C6CFZ8_9BACT|nr:hypothetical protein [Novipirellula galeiformis]TWU23873.1 hypothetical protein Pla52o_17960 [Novipirellula galeiformis]